MANNFIITGRVTGNKLVGEVYPKLEELSRNNCNYWATQAVNALKSLDSGHIKSNVFINTTLSCGGRVEFTMVLPGCTAKVIKNNKGEYLVYGLDADNAYDQMQKRGEKPGLHRATRSDSGWSTKFVSDAKILNKEGRVVAIGDRYQEPERSATVAGPIVKSAPIGGGGWVVNNDGFDLHHTYGKKTIGGMRNIRQAFGAATDPELTESATQLAHTMLAAKNVKRVSWISANGGSGVLTQAMKILRDQGANFEGTEHYVFFGQLTTLDVPAENLAREIGLKFDRDTKSVIPADFNQLFGGVALGGGSVIAAWNRFRQDPDHTALKLGSDVAKQVSSSLGGVKVLQTSAAAGAAAMGIIGVTGGSALGIPASFAFATAVFGAVASMGPGMVKAWLPHYYNKIKDKL